MSARTGLSDIIETVRSHANLGTADYSIIHSGGTITLWSDEEVQKVLDRHRTDIYREPLTKFPDHLGGSIDYKIYQSRHKNLESVESGTAIFYLEDGAGDNVGTASYTADYARGRFVFTDDQDGTSYFLTARAYNIKRAVAEIWRMKASHVSDRFDVRTDTQKFSRSQVMKQFLEMAREYDKLSGPIRVGLDRNDGIIL